MSLSGSKRGIRGLFVKITLPVIFMAALLAHAAFGQQGVQAPPSGEGVSNEQNLPMLYMLAREYIRNKSYDKARETLKKLLTADFILSDHAMFDLAKVEFAAENDMEGLATLDKLVSFYSLSPLQSRAAAMLIEKACEDATSAACVTYLNKTPVAVFSAGFRPELSYIRARQVEAGGRLKESYAMYQEIYVEHPASSTAEKAGKAMKNITQTAPPDVRETLPYMDYGKRFKRGSRLMAAYRYDDAASEFENAIAANPPKSAMPELLYNLGTARKKNREREAAVEAFDRIIAGYPGSSFVPLAQLNAANAEWNLDLDDRAFARLSRLESAEGVPVNIKRQAAHTLGKIAQSHENFTQAISYYKILLRMNPDEEMEDDAAWRIGWIMYRKGDYRAAAEHFTSVARSIPASRQDGRYYYWAAKALEKAGLAQDAETMRRELVKRFPNTYYGTRFKNGEGAAEKSMEAQRERFDRLFATLTKSLNLNPTRWWRYNRFDILTFMKMYDDARVEVGLLAKDMDKTPNEAMWISMLYRKARAPGESIKILASTADIRVRRDDFDDPYWTALYPVYRWETVDAESKKRGLDPFVALSVIRQESAFDERARSAANARGLMQLIPSTAERIFNKNGGEKQGRAFHRDMLFDPEINIPLGVEHFAELVKTYDGEIIYAAAAYNAGKAAVDKWVARYGAMPKDEFVEAIPFSETRDYVKRVSRNLALYHLIYGGATQKQG